MDNYGLHGLSDCKQNLANFHHLRPNQCDKKSPNAYKSCPKMISREK